MNHATNDQIVIELLQWRGQCSLITAILMASIIILGLCFSAFYFCMLLFTSLCFMTMHYTFSFLKLICFYVLTIVWFCYYWYGDLKGNVPYWKSNMPIFRWTRKNNTLPHYELEPCGFWNILGLNYQLASLADVSDKHLLACQLAPRGLIIIWHLDGSPKNKLF